MLKTGCVAGSLLFSALAFAADSYRLPQNAAPLEYELQLSLDPAKDGFEGSIAIAVQVKQATDTIELHAVELDISNARIDGQTATVGAGGTDMISLRVPKTLVPGRVRIELDFRGKYDTKGSRGIFKQTMGSESFVFSHFEPTDARRAFPCFDEPGFKVPWQVTLRTPGALHAFSNAPEAIGNRAKAKSEGNGMKLTRFRPTKPLPSYLIAFAVGNFEVIDLGKVGRKGTHVRTIVPRGDGSSTAAANADTVKILPALEKYFDTAYPFEKLDQVAIPHTVSFSAMEHPGLVSYSRGLLVSEDTGFIQKDMRARTLVHELAHQWFGNLVTHAWWDDIWLNEALASWSEARILSAIFPELSPNLTSVRDKSYSMRMDSIDSARKIRQPANDANEVRAAFDSITYSKGEAVIRMFENFAGETAFRRGVQRYLSRHQWGTVTNADFVKEISEASGKNLAPLFASFLDQSGVPLVRMEMLCGSGSPKVRVTQEHLAPLGSKATPGKTWQLPLCMRFGDGSQSSSQCEVLRDPREEIALKTASCPEWVLGNAGGLGYYSVAYAPEMTTRLTKHVGQLSLTERMEALTNALTLARASQMPAGDALSIAIRFANSEEPSISLAALILMQDLRPFASQGSLPAFNLLVWNTFRDKLRELGMEPKPGESKETGQLRMMLLLAGGLAAPKELAAPVSEAIGRWIADPKSMSADVAYPFVALYAASAGEEEVRQLRNAFLQITDPMTKMMMAAALGFLNGPGAEAGLAILLDPKVDIRELRQMFHSNPGRPEANSRFWNFVRRNYDALEHRLPKESRFDLITATERLCSDEDAKEVRAFFASKVATIERGPRTLAQSEERIRLCSARRSKQAPELDAFFRTQPVTGR